MTALATQRLFPDAAGLRAAAAILRQGGLVAFPTETVYGLGADARNGAAVAAVYAAKGRPAFNPLIVHVTDLDAVRRLCIVHDQAACLARAFWPGALTMVLPLRPDHGIAGLVTAGPAGWGWNQRSSGGSRNRCCCGRAVCRPR